MKHKLEYIALRTIIFFINLMPVPVILWFSGMLGRLAWIIFPYRLDVAYENISNVFPEKGKDAIFPLLKKTYCQFAKTFGLIFILHRKALIKLVENAQISGLDKIHQELKKGKGVILTTYHGCWFEAYFAWFNLNDLPTSLIYQKQANKLSDDYFVSQRGRYGSSLEHIHSQSKMAAYQEALERNRLLIISLDQNYTDNGTPIQFFNKELSCAKGTALLHLRTGAPVMTSVYYMKDGKLHIDFDTVELPEYSEINDTNIGDISQRAIVWYEPWIRTYPEQWFSLFHRLWKKKGYTKIKRNLGDIFLS